MNPMLIERVGWVLIHSLWQFAAVAILASVAQRALRRSSAAVRYGVLVGAMGLMIAGPVVTWVWQSANVPVAHPENSTVIVPELESPSVIGKEAVLGASPAPVRVTDTLALPRPTDTPPPVERNSFSRPSWFERSSASLRPWLAWIVAGWSLGVVLFSARPLLGWYTLRRLRRVGITSVSDELLATMRRVSQRLELRRAVQLSLSTLAQVPIVVGYFKPVILLPISLVTSLPAGQLEAILAHELAHIRRHDFVVNLLQTLIETLFFYHPAVWWLSRRIRVEREHSCDDLVVTLLGNRVEYGRALVAIEQLRGRSTVLALGVHDGSLLDRVRRIVGFTPDSDVSSLAGRWPIALLSVLCLGMPLMVLTSWNLAADRADQDWGTESNGLRCRLIAVPTTVNDESPDISKSASDFARGDEVTFAVELQNVSDQPLTLIGVRHDAKGQPAFEGKLAPEFFAPHLFEFEIKTADGQPVSRPSRAYIEIPHLLSGALTHEIAPGKSLVVLLRPAKFNVPMDYRLASGSYRANVTYRGPGESGLAFFLKQFPNRPHAKAWSGKAASNDVTITVADDPKLPKPPQLVWGEVKDGLQAAVEFRPLPNASPTNDPPGTFPTKPQVSTVFHVKNVSDHAIKFISETRRQLDMVTATNEAGKTKQLEGTFFTGEAIVVRWTLKPGEVAELHSQTPGIGLLDQPGKYKLRYSINFGSLGTAERESEFGFPKKDDWQQVLVAGDVSVTIRAADHEETLKSLDTAPMNECRAVIKKFDEAGEVKLAAMARERLANRWKTIVEQPVASFLRELPKKSPKAEVEFDRGPLIGVQTDLDGVWSNGKGNADNWKDWIVRKQNDYRDGRLQILFEAAAGYRKVEDAASAKRVLQAGLKGHEIYDAEIKTLVGKYWPVTNDDPEKSLGSGPKAWTLANYLGELSSAQQALGELDQAIVTHSRLTLIHFMLSWKHPSAGPTRHARELWSLLRRQPQSTVPLFWFNFVDQQQPLRKFDLTGAGQRGQPLTYHHENLAVAAPHEFAELTITAKTRGRKGILDCYCINAQGKHESIVVLQPSADGESPETLTKTFEVPAGTSLVQFMVAGEDFQVGEVTVEAKFKKPDSSAETSPPKGLEFLKPYPKLHGLSLDMTEMRFKAIVRAGQLAAQSTLSDGGKRQHAVPTGDQHVVVVMFDNGKCTGIQRIRGDNGPQKVTFDSLSVTFKNTHGTRQAEQIDIQANGDCVYHIDELPARGEIAKQPEARLTSKIDPQRMLELERLLAETNWLTRDRSEPQPPPLHSDETPLTVVRDGVATTVKCFAPRDDSYRTLLWLLRGIATQEHFIYKLDWVGGDATNRKLALIDIRFGIEALEERPGRALPFFDFDYRRLLPTFSRMLRNPSQEEDEVLTAIKVAAFVRSADDFEFIARLKHDRNPRVRNTVAIAIADYDGDRAIPILVEMVSSSEEARWGLIRVGDLAVPAIVKLIEPGSSAKDIVSEQMVRSYLDHRKELSGPIDDRVIVAARQALEKTKERSQRTQYYEEFLQLTKEIADVKAKVEAVDTGTLSGLEFLKPYPKLHGLSLDMTEPQFLEIVKQQELETRKTVEDEKATHRMALGDGHTLIVSFDTDAKCSGIQRVRDEEQNPPESFSVVELDPPPVVGDFSKVNDPDELIDSLAKSQLPSLVPQTGGGFYHQPGTPPQAMFIAIWEDQFTADDKLDPRIRRLIELGERALPSVHQRLNGLTASDLLAPHLTLVLRSTEAIESVPVLIKLLKTTPDVVLDGTQGLEDSIRGFRAAVTQIAATSALWKLSGRKHAFTTDQWEKWWQSVKPEFVVLRERKTPEYALRITPQRINDLAKELSTNEVAAREKLIVIGPLALPHLLELPAFAVMMRERDNAQQSDASLKRLAWVIDELGATDKLPAKLRRDYFTQRFEDEGTNVAVSPILEQALCRALNHCSFADFCHICLEADGHLPDKYGSRLRDWMHLNPQVFSRRFNNKSAFDWGERSYSGFQNDVIPAADPAAEIAGAVPVIVAGLSEKEPRVRYCAAKLADIVGLCSQEKPEPLIEALRDHWLTESDANIRLDIGIAMTRFSTPLVMESISKGLRSDRVEILSDAVALMSDLPLALNDATKPDFDLLVQFTRHENDQLRRRAVNSLRFKAPSLLASEFDRLVTDKVEDIRKECAYALRDRPDPKFADVLFKLADDPNEQVRIEALSSIGNLRHPASMERLLPHLRDNKVHGYAVAALTSMGGKDALPLMMSELEAGNDVGGMVYQHLRLLTGEGFEEKPELWLEWWKKNRPAPAPDKDSAANTPLEGRIVEEPLPKPLTKEEYAAAEKRADSIFERTHQIETLNDPGPFINELLAALKDSHRRVRQMAGQALAHGAHVWNEDLRIVDGLIAAIKVEREVDALHQLVQAVGSYRDARAVDSLIDVVDRPEIFSMSSETLRSELEPKVVRDRDEAIRIQVAMALAEIGDRKAIPFLRNLLSPERPMVMEALGKMQDRESVPVFLEALKPPAQWTEATIRHAVSAARALTHVPDEQAFEPMHTLMIDISRLLTERDPFVELRAALCEAISAQANANAATVLLQFTRQLENESLLRAFQSDANEQESEDGNLGQHPAYWPLFHMQAIALPALIAELQAVPQSDRDETRRSRELAAAVLSNLISQGDLQPSDTLSAVPTLIAALEDRSPLVRQFAARSLGLLHSKEAVPALVKLADEPRHSSDIISATNRKERAKYKARSNFVLESVANALSWIGDERAAAAAEKLLKNKAPNVRAAAVFATMSSRHPQTVELLTPLAADENLKVREAAVRQLGFTKNSLAVAPLIRVLKSDDDASLRATAAQSLGLLGDRSAGDALASALDGEPVEPNVRRNAAVALIQLNDDRGLDAFRAMLTDPKGSTRAENVQHLSHVAMFTEYLGRPNWEHPAAREALLKALTTDTDDRVRSWGLGSLQGINSADAIAALQTLARDSSEWVRSNALTQLADSTDPTRTELLVEALDDPHAMVRSMAAGKLKSFNTPASIAALTKALDDTDPAVRESAIASLDELKAALGAKAKLEALSEKDPSPKVQYRAQQVLKSL